MAVSALRNDIHFKSKPPCKIRNLAGGHYDYRFGPFIIADCVIPHASDHGALLYDDARDCYCPHRGCAYGCGHGYARGCG